MNRWASLLIGSPIPDCAERTEQVGPVRGVAMLGLDALASAAYTLLIVIGTASARYVLPLSLIICIVLLLVSLSYRQTIAAYPSGGGRTQSRERTWAVVRVCSPRLRSRSTTS